MKLFFPFLLRQYFFVEKEKLWSLIYDTSGYGCEFAAKTHTISLSGEGSRPHFGFREAEKTAESIKHM
jgi:hypothetical protein